MRMHLNLKGNMGLLAPKLQKYLTYIKLIHTNLLLQCKYHKDCLQGL